MAAHLEVIQGVVAVGHALELAQAPGGLAALDGAAPQVGRRLQVQLVEQGQLPRGEVARPDAGHVDQREQVQLLEGSTIPDGVGELSDQQRIGEVPLLAEQRHRQVLADQQGAAAHLARRQPAALGHRGGNRRPGLALVARLRLAHVVTQGGEVQHPGVVDLEVDRGGQGIVLVVLAPGQALEHRDRPQGVLVHGVHVVGVVLHATADRAELRHHPLEQAELRAQLQGGGLPDIAGLDEQVEEPPLGLGLVGELAGGGGGCRLGDRIEGLSRKLGPPIAGQRQGLEGQHRGVAQGLGSAVEAQAAVHHREPLVDPTHGVGLARGPWTAQLAHP